MHAAWLCRLNDPAPADLRTPADIAAWELQHNWPEFCPRLEVDPALGDGYRFSRQGGTPVLTGGHTGILYGAYRLLFDHLTGINAASFLCP